LINLAKYERELMENKKREAAKRDNFRQMLQQNINIH
jgi:hypothetical protein